MAEYSNYGDRIVVKYSANKSVDMFYGVKALLVTANIICCFLGHINIEQLSDNDDMYR